VGFFDETWVLNGIIGEMVIAFSIVGI
jgi:hypothetical protein